MKPSPSPAGRLLTPPSQSLYSGHPIALITYCDNLGLLPLLIHKLPENKESISSSLCSQEEPKRTQEVLMELTAQEVISGSQMSGDEPGVHSEDGQPLLHKLSLILCS